MSSLIGAITRQYGNITFEAGYAIVKDALKTRVRISIKDEEILLLNFHQWRKFSDFLLGCHTDWYVPETSTLELFFAKELPNNDWEIVCLLDDTEKKINITFHDWFALISNHYNTTTDIELIVSMERMCNDSVQIIVRHFCVNLVPDEVTAELSSLTQIFKQKITPSALKNIISLDNDYVKEVLEEVIEQHSSFMLDKIWKLTRMYYDIKY